MADKASKRKAKPRSVLGALPSSRPDRIGTPRTTARATTTGTRGATVSASASTRSSKPAAKRKRAPAKRAAANGSAQHGPAAVRPGSPPLETHRAASAPPPKPIGAPKGTELVTTSIRAAGELAQIGFMVGGQVLKRAVDRIPRP
jgi:hypothetical protein